MFIYTSTATLSWNGWSWTHQSFFTFTTADSAWLTAENVYLTSSELSWSQNNNNIEYCCQMPQFNNSEEGTIAIARWWLKSNFSWTKKTWTILKYDFCSELCIFSYLNWLWQRNVEKNDLLLRLLYLNFENCSLIQFQKYSLVMGR